MKQPRACRHSWLQVGDAYVLRRAFDCWHHVFSLYRPRPGCFSGKREGASPALGNMCCAVVTSTCCTEDNHLPEAWSLREELKDRGRFVSDEMDGVILPAHAMSTWYALSGLTVPRTIREMDAGGVAHVLQGKIRATIPKKPLHGSPGCFWGFSQV